MNFSSSLSRLARYCFLISGSTLPIFAQGCVAYQFSSHVLTGQEESAARVRLQNLVLGVEAPSNREVLYNLEKFIENLNLTRMFKAVGYLDGLPTADLVLTSFSFRETKPNQACLLGFEGQLLTMATVGVLPQSCKAEHEVSFLLYSPKNWEQGKTVSFTYQTRSILGWVALLYLPSRNWSARPLKEQYPNLLKAVFSREAEGIERLVK
jgi:hypothetical protein